MKGLIEVKNNVLKKGIHYVTSDYKTRNEGRNHKGMDIVSYNGKNTTTDYVICVYDGEVVQNCYNITTGYQVEVKHNNGIHSRYLHLKKGSIVVKKGQKIKKGETIGYMGSTGAGVTGAHLHFGIKVNNVITDPYPYLIDDTLFKDTEYTPGLYVTHYNLYVRTGPGTNYEPKKVKDLTKDGKKHATSKDPNADAVYKEGTRFDVLEIKVNKKQIWGLGYSGWVCLKGKVDYCTKC